MLADVESLRQWASRRQDARQTQAAIESGLRLLKAAAQQLALAGLGEDARPVWDAVSNLEHTLAQIEEALALSASPPRCDALQAAE